MRLKENNIVKDNTMDIVEIGLMAAVIFLVTYLFHVPSNFGTIHLGDSMVLLSVIMMKKRKAVYASAIGMTLFDVLSGYIIWSPFTLIIKALMAYIAATICNRKGYNGENFKNNILGFSIASIFMVIAYYFAGAVVLRFLTKGETYNLSAALILSLKDIPTNCIQAFAAIAIASPLSKALIPYNRK
ncbi:MAG: ECF transporter S component [Clostridiaceae bacterium]